MRAFGMNLAESATKALQHSFVSVLPYLVLSRRRRHQLHPADARSAAVTRLRRSNPQQQMLMKLGPIMITGFSLIVPGALVIYFFVSNLYRVGQQALISRTIYNTPEAKKLLEAQHREAEAKKKTGRRQPKGFLQRMLGDAARRRSARRSRRRTARTARAPAGDKRERRRPAKPPAAKSNGGRTTPPGSRSAAARKKKRRK